MDSLTLERDPYPTPIDELGLDISLTPIDELGLDISDNETTHTEASDTINIIPGEEEKTLVSSIYTVDNETDNTFLFQKKPLVDDENSNVENINYIMSRVPLETEHVEFNNCVDEDDGCSLRADDTKNNKSLEVIEFRGIDHSIIENSLLEDAFDLSPKNIVDNDYYTSSKQNVEDEMNTVQNQLEDSSIECFEPEVSLNSVEDGKELEDDIDISNYLEMVLNSDEIPPQEKEVIDSEVFVEPEKKHLWTPGWGLYSEVSLEEELFTEVEGKYRKGNFFKCKICENMFNTKGGFTRHHTEMHGNKMKNNLGEKRKFEDDTNLNKSLEDPNIEVQEWGVDIFHKQNAECEMNTVENPLGDNNFEVIEPEVIPKEEEMFHPEVIDYLEGKDGEEAKFKCKKCENSFNTKGGFTRHHTEMHENKMKKGECEDDETEEVCEILWKLRPVKDLLRSDVYEEFVLRARNKNNKLKIHETLQDFFIRKNHSQISFSSYNNQSIVNHSMSPVQGSQSMMPSHGNQHLPSHRNQHMTGNQHINQILSQSGENQSMRPHLFPTPPSWNSRGLAPNTIHHRPTLDSSNTLHYQPRQPPIGQPRLNQLLNSSLQKLKVIPKSALRPMLSPSQVNQSMRPNLFSTPPSWNSRGPAPNTAHQRPTLDNRGNQYTPSWNPRGLARNTIHHRPTLDSSNTVHYRAPVGLTKLKVIPKSALQPINQSTLQPINQSSLQPINQSTLQPINQSSLQPINQSTLQPINQSTLQPINQSTLQPINQSTHHPSESNAQYMQYHFEGHSIFQNSQTDFQSPNTNRAPMEKKHSKLKTESPLFQNFQAKSKPQNPNPQQTYHDPRLPEGWYLSGVLRQSGVSKGKFDFYIHGMGKRFRSIREIVRFYDLRSQTGEIEYIDYKVIEECIKTFRKQLMEQQAALPQQLMEQHEVKPDAKED